MQDRWLDKFHDALSYCEEDRPRGFPRTGRLGHYLLRLEAPVDRRRSDRFDLSVPVVYRWRDNQGSHEIGGFSRDISRGEVFVIHSVAPAEGTQIDLEVLLPRYRLPHRNRSCNAMECSCAYIARESQSGSP
jgi:hypothetical protein